MRRSLLYVPGDRPDRFAKAMAAGADAVIFDLEDAVAVAEKDRARAEIATFLGSGDAKSPDAPDVVVRINSDAIETDVEALADVPVDALSLAKASPDGLARLDDALGDRAVGVVALIETAAGLLDARHIAAHHRVINLAVGEADLTAELGLTPSPDERELWPLRMQLVAASAAAEIEPPTGPVSTDFTDTAALALSTSALKRAGFSGRGCIHPAQISVVNEVFTPTEEEIEGARRLVEIFDAAVAEGSGVAVDDDGRMIDEAVVRHARRVLS